MQAVQLIPRLDSIDIGSSFARITLPCYQFTNAVGSGWGDAQLVYFPAAGDPKQGLGTWQIGPAAALITFDQRKDTAIGFFVQSYFSFAGPRTRIYQSAATFTPLFVKRLGSGWSLRSADAMWTFDFKREATLMPLSLGIGKLLALGSEALLAAFSDTVTVVHANATTLPKNTLKLTLRLMDLAALRR